MVLNETKTKVMLFGSSGGEVVNVKINGQPIQQVTSQKYLGVILDAQLDFSLQAEYAAGKAKRASAKVSTLYDGREGIPVQTGNALYKTLVRPHMEYAIPVWAAMSSGDLGKLEKVQAQCLRQIIGAKAHSSTVAIEVITGIVPVRIRIRELCCREFLRIKVKDQNHILRQLLQDTFRISLRFCPLEYLRIMSKQLERALDGCVLEREFSGSSSSILGNINIYKTAIVTHGSVNSQSKTKEEKDRDCAEVNTFVQLHSGKSLLIFTDGSVHNGSVGCGACAAVLFPLSLNEDHITSVEPIGKNVSAVICEIYGIIGGAVAVWVASRPEACRLSQLQGCGFESAPLTSIA